MKPVTRQEPTPELLDDHTLVNRARKGQQTAIDEIVYRYHQKAYAVAFNMCSGDSEEAQDLTQEAFLRAFRSMEKFRGDSSFYTWFYRILVNTCLDGRRRRKKWQHVLSPWKFPDKYGAVFDYRKEGQQEIIENNNPATVLHGKQFKQAVKKAVKSLPKNQQIVFQLKVLHEMRIKEVARIMGIAEGTVKSHLFRAIKVLRETLKEWNGS